MSVVTKQGDDGQSRFGGKVVEKDSSLLEAVGGLDELSCCLGWLKAETELEDVATIQKDLAAIAGLLACGQIGLDLNERIRWFENSIVEMEKSLPVLKSFVVPGKNRREAIVQMCRSVSRRVERRVVSVSKDVKVDSMVLKYLNRLSDYLFILGRSLE